MAECREPDLDKQRISLRKDGCPQDQVLIPSYDTLCQKGTGQVPALGEANGGRVRVSGTGCVLGECQSPGHPGHPHWHTFLYTARQKPPLSPGMQQSVDVSASRKKDGTKLHITLEDDINRKLDNISPAGEGT